MLSVCGVQVKKGQYQGFDYHNVLIHCINDNPTPDTANCQTKGQTTETIKVKFALVKEVFGKPMSSVDWDNLIGEQIRVFFNRFGNPDKIEIVKSN